MVHNILVEEKPPRWPPTRCAYVRARRSWKEGKSVPHSRAQCVHTCGYMYMCAYPRAISYQRPTDNSYLDEAFLPIFGRGGTSSSGLCLCV